MKEYKLTIEQIANLTDQQISELYMPQPKEEKKVGKSYYEVLRNTWLRRGKSLEEFEQHWKELEAKKKPRP